MVRTIVAHGLQGVALSGCDGIVCARFRRRFQTLDGGHLRSAGQADARQRAATGAIHPSEPGGVGRPRHDSVGEWIEAEVPAFLDALDAHPSYPTTKYAVKLLFLTFVRKGELRSARWSEFDLDNALWVVPAERMKMLTEHKANRHNGHDVPLSRQAIRLLEELRPISAGSEFLFPGIVSLEKPIAGSTLNVMFARMGYSGLLTAHGIRATASTILNERGHRGDLIERQLAHRERDGTRAAYNHAKYLDERRQMMQAWADILDEIRLAPPTKENFECP